MSTESAWAFTMDGHTFYVLNTVGTKSLVYDLTARQWYIWYTAGMDFWNMFRGTNWNGKVVAADDSGAQIWELDLYAVLDQEVLQIERVVTGFQPLRGRASILIGNAHLKANVGSPSDAGAAVKLRFSNDEGVTWSEYFEVALAVDDFSQRVTFRSLGRLRAPGRLWEISDTGGLMRIDALDVSLHGMPEE